MYSIVDEEIREELSNCAGGTPASVDVIN